MKKKNLVLLGSAAMLTLALAGSIGTAVSASAATIDQSSGGTAETTVKYSVADSWEVTIPSEIVINEGGTGTVSADNVIIEQGKQLEVSVESTNGWAVKDADENSFEYELKVKNGDGNALTDNDVVLTVEAGTTSGSTDLTATVKSGKENYSTGGDTYEDTLTFTVAVNDAD